jgi:DNA polymerase-3 subunit beta
MLISKHDLARLLSSVTKAVESRNTIPILGTVRLVADGTTLQATATNLDIEITGSVPTDGTLAACVDAKLLAAAVGKAAAGELTIEEEPGYVVVKAGRSRAKLPTLPLEDFPTIEHGEFTTEFETDPAALFAPVAFAMGTDSERFYLCGAYLEPTAVTATNGHKLSNVQLELPEFEPVIVPAATVALAPKGKCKVRLSQSKIQFITDGFTMTSRLIDGTFPDYRRVIPTNLENTATFDGAKLKAAAEYVAIVSQDKEPAVRLDLTSEEITLAARGTGEANDVVPCTYNGPVQTVGFNARYLAECLNSLPAGDVDMSIQDGTGPVVFTSKAAPQQRVVCMPRRV